MARRRRSPRKSIIIRSSCDTPVRKTDDVRFDTLAAMACLATLACWSSAPIFIKYLTGYVDAFTQNFLRYGAACLFWLPLLIRDARAGRVTRAVFVAALLPAAPNI